MEFQRNNTKPWMMSLLAMIAVIALDPTIHALASAARVCVLGTEPDGSRGGRVRFVLPPGDPCSCTQVRLGGHNTYAPPRQDQPVYIDTLPMDVEGLRRSQGCSEISTIEVTSAVPTTTAIPDFTDCQDVLDWGHETNGVYNILVDEIPTQAFCELQPGSPGKGFIVIQKRIDGSVDFNRNWAEYQEGFGDLEREFWWGNNKLQSLTDNEVTSWELVVDLEAFDGTTASVRYDSFSITGAEYDLTVSGFHNGGSAGDALDSHQHAFTTKDDDNDNSGGKNCAVEFNGGWWHDTCKSLYSNLNGIYSHSESVAEYQGVQWAPWKGRFVSLKGCQMKIRRTT